MTTHHLYALLVGINQYDKRSSVSSLSGCVNDVKAMQSYLESQICKDDWLHIRTLIDEQATRQAVIDGFRQHLQQAQAGDTVLFYYAGHGSQASAPPEFWAIEPDRLNETLVCYDSRVENNSDLADKELAKLIYEVSQSNPHITIVLDCCHSGAATRGETASAVTKRRAPVDWRDRPIESFIVTPQELQKAKEQTPPLSRSLDATTSGWQMFQGRHVLMAACLDTEEASEHFDDRRPCGAFSYFLLHTLRNANGSLTYRDLFSGTYAKMRSQISDQSPQLEASYLEDLDQPFLGGAIAPLNPYFTLSHCQTYGWSINGGAVHGVQPPANHETTQLALFPFDSSPEDRQQLENAVGRASVINVLPQLSRIQTEAVLDPVTVYKAVVIDLPLPPLSITLKGDIDEVSAIRQALRAPTDALSPAHYVQEVSELGFSQFCVLAQASEYTITRSTGDRPLVATFPNQNSNAIPLLLQKLAHLARWTTLATLASPAASQLSASAVEIQLYRNDQRIESKQLRLSYEQHGDQWQPPHFRVRLVNTTSRRLYCTLLNLTEQYSVSAPFFSSGGIWLEAHGEAWATVMVGSRLTDQISTSVPQALWEEGITEYQDILKLIASTAEFDPTLLLQRKLEAPAAIAQRGMTASPQSTLSQLMNRATTRDIGAADSVSTIDDWTTQQVVITTIRPQATGQVSASRSVSLSGQMVVQPHAHLRANVRLTAMGQSTRSAETPSLPPLLRECTQALQFAAKRGTDPGLTVLELSQIRQADAVTPEAPLTLSVNTSLAPGESVLPVAYDGEFFLPLGYARPQGDQTEIVLQRLPQVNPGQPTPTDLSDDSADTPRTRSISGALQIFFRKVATETLGDALSQKLGLSFEYPILAAVDLSSPEQETTAHIADTAEIASRVAQSENIVVYIHGITGSTQSMIPSVQSAHLTVADQTRSIGEAYDLVLTYDYESLNTSIETSAIQLKQRLAAVGIVPEHGKTVHIIAHSMGGLVSRWFVEKEGGDQLIQHLIMLGTPNAGSPWPVVQAGLTKALSFAINGLATVVWPLTLIGSVLNALEAIDVALDEMEPNSELLALLAASEPSIPYSIVAGNTQLIPLDEKATLRARLEQKLNQFVALPFLKEENDIAVSVSSIRCVPAGRKHVPQVREVACNHMDYFTDPVGLAGLSWAVEQAFATNKPPGMNSLFEGRLERKSAEKTTSRQPVPQPSQSATKPTAQDWTKLSPQPLHPFGWSEHFRL